MDPATIAIGMAIIEGAMKLWPLIQREIEGLPEGQEKEELQRRVDTMRANVRAASANWNNSVGPQG